MLEPIAALAAASSISSLEEAIQTSDYILRLQDQHYVIRQLELDVQVNLQKFRAWQKAWSGDKEHPDVYGQALWGIKGWTHIRRMLHGIGETSRNLADYLDGLNNTEETNPRSRWKKAFKVIQIKQGPGLKMQELQKLQNLSTTLNRIVDGLLIYSETVFDSIHPVSSLEPKVPESDRLLQNALRSRSCSLELYYSCSLSKLRCSLEMDLFDSGKAPSTRSEASPSVTYHLVAQSREAPGTFIKQMAIESVETSATVQSETDGMSVQKMENLQLFHSTGGDGTTLLRVAARGAAQLTYFRIPQKNNRPMTLDSDPESLANLLNRRQSANFSTQEHLSVGIKVELAYKVVECGFFLLGTPWFASLSSKNLLRLRKRKKTHYSFCLETQTLDLDDLLYDDPGALAETSQLFRLGVLLMEIALGKPSTYTRSDEVGQEADRISNLPLVEQNMGAQYCRATAFCLQYQQSGTPFNTHKVSKDNRYGKNKLLQETEKYEDPNFDVWQTYLAGFLQQYHSQVYMKIQALREKMREVERVTKQRSVKSWQEPVKGEGD